MFIHLFTGFIFAIFISFADSFSYRLLESFYRKSRKSIQQKWKYVLKSRSFCENCHGNIHPLYLIPIFGYMFSKSRCALCDAKLSSHFLYFELLAFTFGFTIAFFQSNPVYLLFTGLYMILIYILSRIDWKFFLIPTQVIVFFLVLALIELFFFSENQKLYFELHSTILQLITSFAWFLIFYLIHFFYPQGLGLADVKLIFAMSIALPFPLNFFLPTLASCLGLIFYLTTQWKKSPDDRGLKTKLPFGVFLGIGFLLLRIFYGFV